MSNWIKCLPQKCEKLYLDQYQPSKNVVDKPVIPALGKWRKIDVSDLIIGQLSTNKLSERNHPKSVSGLHITLQWLLKISLESQLDGILLWQTHAITFSWNGHRRKNIVDLWRNISLGLTQKRGYLLYQSCERTCDERLFANKTCDWSSLHSLVKLHFQDSIEKNMPKNFFLVVFCRLGLIGKVIFAETDAPAEARWVLRQDMWRTFDV